MLMRYTKLDRGKEEGENGVKDRERKEEIDDEKLDTPVEG